ncbi:MAG: Mth938-like domain-containing protein [Bacteroidota bacterium]|nr:Mth938-like domain-containing protein [Bacteroidota bacterium]
MKTMIDSTYFGSITISGKIYEHDVVIGLDGQVRKRMKELSRTKYGTSHIVSFEEANDLFEAGANQLIIGTGQTGYVKLSEEAADYFRDNECSVLLFPTQQAIEAWNAAKGPVIGLFHVTC